MRASLRISHFCNFTNHHHISMKSIFALTPSQSIERSQASPTVSDAASAAAALAMKKRPLTAEENSIVDAVFATRGCTHFIYCLHDSSAPAINSNFYHKTFLGFFALIYFHSLVTDFSAALSLSLSLFIFRSIIFHLISTPHRRGFQHGDSGRAHAVSAARPVAQRRGHELLL